MPCLEDGVILYKTGVTYSEFGISYTRFDIHGFFVGTKQRQQNKVEKMGGGICLS